MDSVLRFVVFAFCTFPRIGHLLWMVIFFLLLLSLEIVII